MKKITKYYNIVRKAMQATENFYNVLWWRKNPRQYRQDDELDYESSGNPTPITTSRHHHIATATKDFAQYWKSMPARVEAFIDAKGWYTQY